MKFTASMAALLALKNAIKYAKRVAPNDHDIVIHAHNVVATKVVYTKPDTFTFRGIDQSGQHSSVTLHVSQLVARVGLRPKVEKSRTIAGFANTA